LHDPKDVVERSIGAPDDPNTSGGKPGEYAWSCGCRALVQAENISAIVPCDELEPEFEDSD